MLLLPVNLDGVLHRKRERKKKKGVEKADKGGLWSGSIQEIVKS
jgi:hypothetical protein